MTLIPDIATLVKGAKSLAANATASLPLPDPRTLLFSHPHPIFSLSVDGNNITTDIAPRLSSLTLTDSRGFDADQLDIVLDDSDGKLELPPRGAVLNLQLGWRSTGLIDKGTFIADEINHDGPPDILTIRARSADLRSGLTTRRERSFHGKTVGDIVRTIAAENDLDPVISAALDQQVIEHIDQTNESSANLLTRIAGMFDAFATVKNGKLLFIFAGAATSATGKPIPAITITRASGDKHHFGIADRGNYTHVRACWYDTDVKIKSEVIWGKIEEDATNSNKSTPITATAVKGEFKPLGKTYKSRATAKRAARIEWGKVKKIAAQRAKFIGVKAGYDDLNLKASGIVTYGQADEQKDQQNAQKLSVKDAAKLATAQPATPIEASADNIKTLRHIFASEESATRAARTNWRRIQRGMAEFSISLALGNPALFPDMPATIQGFKREIDNTDWIITKATHTLSTAGLTTALEFEIKATEIPG